LETNTLGDSIKMDFKRMAWDVLMWLGQGQIAGCSCEHGHERSVK